MQKLSFVFSMIKNKYLLSVLVFVVWISFFDRNDLFTQWERKNELEKLETSKAYYEAEIISTEKELAELQNNPAALEKFARENFYLKRPEEQVFIVVKPEVENSEVTKQ
ncbi:FtsB family cell division protein [Aridibaculum aurantiacum]|uniref:FtsB family cell division protein n=1 Tax=Aridibaculum aurantiacum TaxID=2810307 RepID=UPI001A969405|nr:septum formation initiator family protein [Aridibaculum aurantiacum]